MANQSSAENKPTNTNRNFGSDKKPDLDKNKQGQKKEMSSQENESESQEDSEEEQSKWNNVSQLDKDKKVPQQPAR